MLLCYRSASILNTFTYHARLGFQRQSIAGMHLAQVKSWTEAPRYVEAPNPPVPADGQLQLRVLASGLHQVVRSRASGQHYTASRLPHTVGVDGVGVDEATGQTYYFSGFAPDFGSFADYVTVAKQQAIPVPEGADPVRIAAFFNPAMSSWMALRKRTFGLRPGYTCLVLGVTSASGTIAVPLAKALGAGKVIGLGRNEAAMGKITGLDEAIVIRSPLEETDLSRVECDVILDYVYGDLATHVLKTIRTPKPVQFVQIGTVGGSDATIPGGTLRSKDLTIRGAGPGAWQAVDMDAGALIAELVKLKLPEPARFALRDIEKLWDDKEALKQGRPVFIP